MYAFRVAEIKINAAQIMSKQDVKKTYEISRVDLR